MSELGTDFECTDDITTDWAVAATPEIAYQHAIYRRLSVSRLFYSTQEYGQNVDEYLLETALTETAMRQEIEAECLKDERTRSVAVTFADNIASIRVTPHIGRAFNLTLDLNASTIADALRLPESATLPGQD